MKIIIVGGGFAGRWAAGSLHALRRKHPEHSITLFDANAYTTMYPALPTVVSGDFGIETVTGSLPALLPEGIEFRQERVTRVDCRQKSVTTAERSYPYDYLVLACGSKTNFRGFDQSLEAVHTLDGMESALRLECALNDYLGRSARATVVIVGGSYNGVELACEIYKLGRRRSQAINIVIVEAGREILALLDEKVRPFCREHLRRLGIRTITGATVQGFDGKDVRLSTGESLQGALLCWCAGTTRSIEAVEGDFETLPDKRIVVNEFLQVPKHPEVFAPPDTGAFKYRGQYLRKAVNFSVYAGKWAGRNVMRAAEGRQLAAFRPRDFGEVLPLYNTSAGTVLGFITGRPGLRLHYFMTGYRNFTAANRMAFFARALAPSAD